MAKLLPGTDPIHKVTIIPRGMALGVTQQLPEDDRYHYPQSYLVNRLCVALGGRVAERLVFNDVSTGAQSDLKMVTDLAEKMVCQWGMSEKIGADDLQPRRGAPLPGQKLAEEKSFSEEMAWLIDQEIAAVIEEAEEKAAELVVANRDKLDALGQRPAWRRRPWTASGWTRFLRLLSIRSPISMVFAWRNINRENYLSRR